LNKHKKATSYGVAFLFSGLAWLIWTIALAIEFYWIPANETCGELATYPLIHSE
jgi:hypothetical protein